MASTTVSITASPLAYVADAPQIPEGVRRVVQDAREDHHVDRGVP